MFGDSIFKGRLSPNEQARFFRTVKFHLDVYDIVQTRMYTPDGTIVYSYTPSQVGTSAFDSTPNSPAREAARGQKSSATVGAEVLAGQIPNPPRPMLAVWIPIHRDGQVIGITEVSRNLEHTIGAVRQMQFAVFAMVALGSSKSSTVWAKRKHAVFSAWSRLGDLPGSSSGAWRINPGRIGGR